MSFRSLTPGGGGGGVFPVSHTWSWRGRGLTPLKWRGSLRSITPEGGGLSGLSHLEVVGEGLSGLSHLVVEGKVSFRSLKP